MDINKLSDLPDWDDERLSFMNDAEGEEWKPDPTRELCKNLYVQWQQVMFVLKGVLAPFMEIQEEDAELLQLTTQNLLHDAYMTGVKIRSSEAGGIYIMRMENASIIRQLAQGISTTLLLFMAHDKVDQQHIYLVRGEIDKFRNIFIEWVASFQKDEFTDDWGLFI